MVNKVVYKADSRCPLTTKKPHVVLKSEKAHVVQSWLANARRPCRHRRRRGRPQKLKPGTDRVQPLADISRSAICCHSNEIRAPIANPPNSAQLRGTPYHRKDSEKRWVFRGGCSENCWIWYRVSVRRRTVPGTSGSNREYPVTGSRKVRATVNDDNPYSPARCVFFRQRTCSTRTSFCRMLSSYQGRCRDFSTGGGCAPVLLLLPSPFSPPSLSPFIDVYYCWLADGWYQKILPRLQLQYESVKLQYGTRTLFFDNVRIYSTRILFGKVTYDHSLFIIMW